MKVLAIIPARSGSKGLINKNIKELAGKPLIAYTIEAALKSDIFSEVMVSTDTDEYAAIAEKYGANVPFLREKSTSGDRASTWDTVREVLAKYKEKNTEFDAFCVLQPTSPLRDFQDILSAYKIFLTKATVAVISVCETEHSPLWSGRLLQNNSLDGFIPKNNMKQRQEHEKYYRLNGAIYFVYIDEFMRNDNFYRSGSYAYIMDKQSSVDIDDEMDFLFAELLMKMEIKKIDDITR